MNSPQPPLLLRFAAFDLDLRARELRKDGRSTGLPDQSITILAMLLAQPGELVLREGIRTTLWPNDTVVEFDHSINTAIGRLRQALGDSAENPKFIETLPRRGYRWIGPAISSKTREQQEQIEWTPPVVVEPTPQRTPSGNLIGKKVSHYRVFEVLGGGGMGVVYKAEDLKLGRRVALKFLPEEIASDIGARQRFESEARLASALNHPNICTIYGVEEFEGQPFLVMELLQGQTLRDLIAAVAPGKLQPGMASLLDVAVQILAGLEAAHNQGIIHRDIKPANIFLTSEGQAKILDFGLAKVALSESTSEDSPIINSYEELRPYQSADEAESLTASSPFLSRTGVAMGTARYMSPEQVRGEKLDARTDLFSIGLVLYEMATGKRAFSGATGQELKENIISQMPSPARKVNPALPEKLAKIIHRALEKTRDARYQSASELRTDLENLKREIAPGSVARRWAMTTAGVVILLVASAALWFAKRQPQPSGALPEIKLRRLTTNSSENPVQNGSISPDGKYLAYIDRLGMHIKLIETGETRTIPPPDDIKIESVEWQLVPGFWWFPDSTRFLAFLQPRGRGFGGMTSQNSSIWIVSVLGGSPRKLRDSAVPYSISPDGSLISFGTNPGRLGDREIWVMQPDGGQARKVFEIDDPGTIGGLQWSPDGQSIIYFKTVFKDSAAATHWDESDVSFHAGFNYLSQFMIEGDLKGGPLTTVLAPVDYSQVPEVLWLPDGRMVYRLLEQGNISATCNLWQIRFDPRTMEFIGKPQRITNLPADCPSGFSATSDGKHLVFLEDSGHASVYLADLQAEGTRITPPTRLTLDDGWNNPAAWSADSKVVFFSSDRPGRASLFRQPLGQDAPEAVFTAKDEGVEGNICLSPDGLWVLYGPVRTPSLPDRYMRVPVTGGTPQVIYTGELYGRLWCSNSRAALCVIGERSADRKQLSFSAFDPEKGRGPKLAEFAAVPEASYESRVSPDGTRIAVSSGDDRIHILWLNGRPPQDITVKDWKQVSAVFWAADSNSLFASSSKDQVPVVLRIDLQGKAQVLWEVQGGVGTYVVPSPDGRHLAMQKITIDANMWLMEHF